MTEREKFILRAALIYAQSNLDDVNLAFEHDGSPDDPQNEKGLIDVNGDEGKYLNEVEVAGPAAAKSLRTKDLRLLKNSEKIPQRA